MMHWKQKRVRKVEEGGVKGRRRKVEGREICVS